MNNFKTMGFFLIDNKIKQNNKTHMLHKLWDKIKYGPKVTQMGTCRALQDSRNFSDSLPFLFLPRLSRRQIAIGL